MTEKGGDRQFQIYTKFKKSCSSIDRDAKKFKFSDCLAEFSVYSNGKSKNFLSKKFSKIFQNGGAMHGDIYIVKTSIF